MTYMILFCAIILLYGIQYKTQKRVNEIDVKASDNQKISRWYFIVITAMMLILIGFRSVRVGVDTVGYYRVFNKIHYLGLENYLNSIEVEKGYAILQYIIGQFGNFQGLLIFEGLLFLIPFTYIVYKYSDKPWLSYFIFVAFGFLTFSMSGIRQTLALGCTMIAFLFAKKNNVMGFLISIFIACSFHMTAIFFLPAYWLNKFKISRKNILLFISGIILIYIFKTQIFNLMNANARLECPTLETGGDLMYLFYVGTLLMGLVYRKQILKSSENNMFLFCAMFAVVMLFPLCKSNPTLFRMTYYYSIFMTIFIPNVISAIKDKGIRYILTTFYVGISIYYIIFKGTEYSMHVLPYSFFWQ